MLLIMDSALSAVVTAMQWLRAWHLPVQRLSVCDACQGLCSLGHDLQAVQLARSYHALAVRGNWDENYLALAEGQYTKKVRQLQEGTNLHM